MTTTANELQVQSIPELIKAVRAADTAALEQLLAGGADVNIRTPNGMTALMCAAANGYSEIVSQLLARGADINIALRDGVTALTLAAYYGHHQVVRDLIASGAHVTAIGKLRASPETWANEHGFADVIDLLRQARKVEDIKDEDEPKDVEVLEQSEPEVYLKAAAVEDPEWIKISDTNEVSPASIWAPEDEDEITLIRNAGAVSPSRETQSVMPSGARLAIGRIGLDYAGTDASQSPPALPDGGTDQEEENEETLGGITRDEDLFIDHSFFMPQLSSSNEQIDVPLDFSLSNEHVDVPHEPSATAAEPKEEESLSFKRVHHASLFDESFGPIESDLSHKPKTNAANRPKVLDESYVLPGEASFATVMLNQNAQPHYSPISELLIKLRSNARLIVVTLLVVIGSTIATLAFLNSSSLLVVFSRSSSAATNGTALQQRFSSKTEAVTAPKKTTTSGVEDKFATPPPAATLESGTVIKTNETPAPKEKVTKSDDKDSSKTMSPSSRVKTNGGKAQPVAYKEREKPVGSIKSTSAKKPAATNKTVVASKTRVKKSSSSSAGKEITRSQVRRELGSTADARPSPVNNNGSQRPRRVASSPDSP